MYNSITMLKSNTKQTIALFYRLSCVFNSQDVVDINGVHFFVISFISAILYFSFVNIILIGK